MQNDTGTSRFAPASTAREAGAAPHYRGRSAGSPSGGLAFWAKHGYNNRAMRQLGHFLVVVKGAGDLATGVIARLSRSGFRVVATEIPQPTVIRRTVALAQAIYDGKFAVEDLTARRVSLDQVDETIRQGAIPVLVDLHGDAAAQLRPHVVVDAIVAKRNLGTRITDAALVIALGPGFTVGLDCHAIVETNRGHYLGRVLHSGSAEPDTGIPGALDGHGWDRILRAPAAGIFRPILTIGDTVAAGDVAAFVNDIPVIAPLGGVLRGLLREGLQAPAGMKVGDVDPRATRDHCFTISDKALAIGGGVLEAILARLN
jgi:xanthine dehydrogenase accessory factor